ncbi:hypothetical protein EKO04_004190 [Ascochyta lentis]|uniref:DUF1772-domain-containing protein n=1 Tax=Ascochyta lentis TaxID=205686 RepID=A0A8H7J8W4_9PLEO|nr:hypothetical protein EKO04_004190 [Ascochyta lentis]
MTTETVTILVQALQITVATSLIFIGGLSSCLSLWIMPLTTLLPPHLAASQFTQTVTWGSQYLQPTSRLLAASLLLTTLLTYCLPTPEHAAAWPYWAAALAVLLPVAPYEVIFIFPINERVQAIAGALEGGGDEKGAKRELVVLLQQWRVRNYGRVGMPVVAGVVAWCGVVRG